MKETMAECTKSVNGYLWITWVPVWSGCPQGLGHNGALDKNNINSSESNHPSKTKIMYASKQTKLEC